MQKASFVIGVFLSLLILLFSAEVTAAQDDGPTDDEVNAIAKQLFCPVCENVPLDVCPTEACENWREEIRQKLASGWSEEQIKQYFVEQHGYQVLSSPPPEGLNLLVYILPPAAFILGGVVLYRALRRWRVAYTRESSRKQSIDEIDPYIARLEEELRKRA
jgi:cytochrome c-type biogenesis protein CcmH